MPSLNDELLRRANDPAERIPLIDGFLDYITLRLKEEAQEGPADDVVFRVDGVPVYLSDFTGETDARERFFRRWCARQAAET